MEGWIKIHRKIIDWEWFQDDKTFKVFVHLLLTANYEDDNWKGITIKRGQRIFGYRKLSEETKISVQSIRTCIERLKSTHEVTIESTHQYSIVTVCKYEEYQLRENGNNTPFNTQINIQSTHDQHNLKNIRKEEEDLKENLIREKIPIGKMHDEEPEREAELAKFLDDLLHDRV